MSYFDLLKDPRWQRKRLEVMQRADFTCEWCGDKERTQHVHHVRYIKGRKPWEYDNELLKCLCETCHAEYEHDIVEITELLNESPYLRDFVLVFLRTKAWMQEQQDAGRWEPFEPMPDGEFRLLQRYAGRPDIHGLLVAFGQTPGSDAWRRLHDAGAFERPSVTAREIDDAMNRPRE